MDLQLDKPSEGRKGAREKWGGVRRSIPHSEKSGGTVEGKLQS